MIANNVTRLLDNRKINYKTFELPRQKLGAEQTASLLNVPLSIIFKSIVIERVTPGKPILAVVPGDYDGDGSCDITMWRPSNGYWYIRDGATYSATWWGNPTDIPVPGDYDGDGTTDIAVLRPSNGKWYIQGVGHFSWYAAGDYPLPVRDTNSDGDPYH